MTKINFIHLGHKLIIVFIKILLGKIICNHLVILLPHKKFMSDTTLIKVNTNASSNTIILAT